MRLRDAVEKLLGRDMSLGAQGERIAARFLHRNGFRVLERNVHLGSYEIDIIAQEGDTIAFVEVKTRRPLPLVAPEENVTAAKQRHIRHAAHRYIDQNGSPELYYRYDIVSVILPEQGRPHITLYRDAFPDQ